MMLVVAADGAVPEAPDLLKRRGLNVDSATLAAYREAMYEAGLRRAAWWQEVLKDAETDDP